MAERIGLEQNFAFSRSAPIRRTTKISLLGTKLYNSLHEDREVNSSEIPKKERKKRIGGQAVSLPNFAVFFTFCSEWNGPQTSVRLRGGGDLEQFVNDESVHA